MNLRQECRFFRQVEFRKLGFASEKNVLWKQRLGGILALTYLGLSPLC